MKSNYTEGNTFDPIYIPPKDRITLKIKLSNIESLINNFIGTLSRPIITDYFKHLISHDELIHFALIQEDYPDTIHGKQDVSNNYPFLEPFSDEFESARENAMHLISFYIEEINSIHKDDLMEEDCISFINAKLGEIQGIRISEHIDDGYRQCIIAALKSYYKQNAISNQNSKKEESTHPPINNSKQNKNIISFEDLFEEPYKDYINDFVSVLKNRDCLIGGLNPVLNQENIWTGNAQVAMVYYLELVKHSIVKKVSNIKVGLAFSSYFKDLNKSFSTQKPGANAGDYRESFGKEIEVIKTRITKNSSLFSLQRR